ncbi:MAG: aldolase [Rhodospirillales bacterium]|nr:aldolase [Rhodospirillales bacterium]
MSELKNAARERLLKGELSLGVGLRQARTVDIAKIMAVSGMDWLFIDLEHNSMPLDTAVQISVAALYSGIAPLVRIPIGAYGLATRALDGGALGIVVPHVDSAIEAREAVSRLKYPPLGHRSIGPGLPHFGYARLDPKTITENLNRETLLTVMLETPAAIEAADEIAAVDGVDVVMIGTSDLSAEMGINGQTSDARIVAAYETVLAACKKHGKWPGMGGVPQVDVIEAYVKMGMRFILTGNDLAFMMSATKNRADQLREFV